MSEPHNHLDAHLRVTHDHFGGTDLHSHSEEVEVAIARLLNGRAYTGLSPDAQRAVTSGICAMRRQLAAGREQWPPPRTGELRAPLVTRVKGEAQR